MTPRQPAATARSRRSRRPRRRPATRRRCARPTSRRASSCQRRLTSPSRATWVRKIEPGLVARGPPAPSTGSRPGGHRRRRPPRPAPRDGRRHRGSGSSGRRARRSGRRRAGRRSGAGRGGAGQQIAGGVDEVAEHGAGRGQSPGTPAVEHELAGRLALDEHGVEGAAHRGQRVGRRAPSPDAPGPTPRRRRSAPRRRAASRRSRAGRRTRCRRP